MIMGGHGWLSWVGCQLQGSIANANAVSELPGSGSCVDCGWCLGVCVALLHHARRSPGLTVDYYWLDKAICDAHRV
jgi:hypothetical protein